MEFILGLLILICLSKIARSNKSNYFSAIDNHTRLFLFADDLGLCADGDSMPPEEYHDILEQLYIIKT